MYCINLFCDIDTTYHIFLKSSWWVLRNSHILFLQNVTKFTKKNAPEKYHRKFQTDDGNLEFAAGTFAFFPIISYMVYQNFHSSITVSGEKSYAHRLSFVWFLLLYLFCGLLITPLCQIDCAPFSGITHTRASYMISSLVRRIVCTHWVPGSCQPHALRCCIDRTRWACLPWVSKFMKKRCGWQQYMSI